MTVVTVKVVVEPLVVVVICLSLVQMAVLNMRIVLVFALMKFILVGCLMGESKLQVQIQKRALYFSFNENYLIKKPLFFLVTESALSVMPGVLQIFYRGRSVDLSAAACGLGGA